MVAELVYAAEQQEKADLILLSSRRKQWESIRQVHAWFKEHDVRNKAVELCRKNLEKEQKALQKCRDKLSKAEAANKPGWEETQRPSLDAAIALAETKVNNEQIVS